MLSNSCAGCPLLAVPGFLHLTLMSVTARSIDFATFEIVTERLASASKRMMRPLTLIGVTELSLADACRAARDSDTAAMETIADGIDTVWVLCPDTGVAGGAILAARLVQMGGVDSKGVVVGFPHAVLDPADLLGTGQDLARDLPSVDAGQVLIASDEDGNVPIELGSDQQTSTQA
jgi:hypothetical protein